MFHRRFLESARHELSELENVHLIDDQQWEDAVRQAREQASAENPMFDLPVGVVIEEGKVGAVFDGHRIKKLREWFQSPQGQAFKAILKKIAMAILMGLISGS